MLDVIFQILTIYGESIGPNRFAINNILNFSGRNIYTDDTNPSEYNTLCEQLIKQLTKTVIIIVAAIVLSYCIMGFWPLYNMIFEEDRVTFLNTEIPFLDINTDFGYSINLLIQSIIIAVTLLASISIEIGACLTYNAVTAVPAIIHFEIQELQSDLNLNGKSCSAKFRMKRILMKLQDFHG